MQSYKITLLSGVLVFFPIFGMETDAVLRRSRGNSTIVQTIITKQADSPLGSRPHTPLEPINIGFFENEHPEMTDSDCDYEQEIAFFDIPEQEDTPAQAFAKPSSHYLHSDKSRPSRADRDKNWREKKPSIITVKRISGLKPHNNQQSSSSQTPQKSFTLYSPKTTSSATQTASLVVAASAMQLHQRKSCNRFDPLTEEQG